MAWVFPYILYIKIFFVLLAIGGTAWLGKRLFEKSNKATPAKTKRDDGLLCPVVLNDGLYKHIFGFVGGSCFVFAALAAVTWDVMLGEIDGFGFNLGFLFILPPFIYLCLSVKEVTKDRVGCLYFYGIALKNVGPGIHFVPFGIMKLLTECADIQEIIEPGPRDKIFWGEEDAPLPAGMVRPIFVNSRSQTEGEDRALDVQMQYGLGYFLFWKVSDPATYFQNTRSLAEGTSQLKLVSLSLLDQIIGQRTTEGTVADQKNVGSDLRMEISNATIGMGVAVTNAGLVDINLSHAMATAMRDRAKAKFEAETLAMQTEVEASRMRQLGAAKGDALRDEEAGPLLGRAKGLAAVKKEMGVDGHAVLASGMLEKALPRAVVMNDPHGLFGLLASGAEALKAMGPEQKGTSS